VFCLQAAERILAAEEAEASRAAQAEAEGGAQQQSGADALMEMGKLNTARIRKAVDPRILDVKKRVRQARRSLKRESKVVLSDEIIFFDDVAGNEQAKVGVVMGCGWVWSWGLHAFWVPLGLRAGCRLSNTCVQQALVQAQ
jgi:hypothetical protein